MMLQPTVKRVNKKRPGEASDDFMVGRGAKWSKCDAELPEWDHEFAAVEEKTRIKWKSPKFMARTERKGPMRVKGILKKVSLFLPMLGWANLLEGKRER